MTSAKLQALGKFLDWLFRLPYRVAISLMLLMLAPVAILFSGIGRVYLPWIGVDQPLSGLGVVLCLILGSLFIGFGLFGVYVPQVRAEYHKRVRSGATHVTFPQVGQRVEVASLKMTHGLGPDPKGRYWALWPVVYSPESGRYYPHPQVSVGHDGTLGGCALYFGQPGEVDKPFELMVIAASCSAHRAFWDYVSEAQTKNDWQGLDELPSEYCDKADMKGAPCGNGGCDQKARETLLHAYVKRQPLPT